MTERKRQDGGPEFRVLKRVSPEIFWNQGEGLVTRVVRSDSEEGRLALEMAEEVYKSQFGKRVSLQDGFDSDGTSKWVLLGNSEDVLLGGVRITKGKGLPFGQYVKQEDGVFREDRERVELGRMFFNPGLRGLIPDKVRAFLKEKEVGLWSERAAKTALVGKLYQAVLDHLGNGEQVLALVNKGMRDFLKKGGVGFERVKGIRVDWGLKAVRKLIKDAPAYWNEESDPTLCRLSQTEDFESDDYWDGVLKGFQIRTEERLKSGEKMPGEKLVAVWNEETAGELFKILEVLESVPDSEEGWREVFETVGLPFGGLFKRQAEDMLRLRTKYGEHLGKYFSGGDLLRGMRAEWIFNQDSGKWCFLPERELYKLLYISRMVGLVPVESIFKLMDQRILVVGASVASNSIMQLVLAGAGMGEGEITLIDDGLVTLEKLGVIYGAGIEDVGRAKVEVVAREVERRAPWAKIRAIKGRVNEENAGDYVEEADLVIQAIDEVRMKERVNQETLNQGKVLYVPTDTGSAPFVQRLRESVFGRELSEQEKHILDRARPGSLEFLYSAIKIVGEDQIPLPLKSMLVMKILLGACFVQRGLTPPVFGHLPQDPRAAAVSGAELSAQVSRDLSDGLETGDVQRVVGLSEPFSFTRLEGEEVSLIFGRVVSMLGEKLEKRT